MKLKIDLHPIFSDSRKIEQGLNDIIAEAAEKRASEVEIIPGKGSGALKKTVLRFLERPEIKSQYHRVEKDDENFGRVFVHFRHSPERSGPSPSAAKTMVSGICFCCLATVDLALDDPPIPGEQHRELVECGACGSPNRLIVAMGRSGKLSVIVEPGYEGAT